VLLFFTLRNEPTPVPAAQGNVPAQVNVPRAPQLTPPTTPSTTHPQPQPTPPPAKPIAEAPKPARVHVGGTAGAEILLDGTVVGNVPADLVLTADAKAHELVVQRAGFGRFTRSIALVGDRDLSLDAKLQRIPVAAPPHHAVAHKPKTTTTGGVKLADPFADEQPAH
jgi:hypothetical protein